MYVAGNGTLFSCCSSPKLKTILNCLHFFWAILLKCIFVNNCSQFFQAFHCLINMFFFPTIRANPHLPESSLSSFAASSVVEMQTNQNTTKPVRNTSNKQLATKPTAICYTPPEQIILTQNPSIHITTWSFHIISCPFQSPRIPGSEISRRIRRSQLHVGCASGGLEVLLSPMFQALHDFVGHQLVEHGIQPPRALVPGAGDGWDGPSFHLGNWPSGGQGPPQLKQPLFSWGKVPNHTQSKSRQMHP